MSKPKQQQSSRKPLLDKHTQFQELADKATRQLEILGGLIDSLEISKEELTRHEKEKAARKKMREMAVRVNKMITQIADIFRELKVLKFTKPKDKEDRKKTMKRLRGYFTRQHDRFVQSLSTFQEKERIYIEERKSILSAGSSILSEQGQKYFESISDPGIETAMQDIDFYQALLEERELHLQQVRGIAYEMKLMAEDQAKAITENQGDLENAVSAMSVVERMVDDGQGHLEEVEKKQSKKRIDSACKRNIAVCLLVVIICCIVLIVTLTSGVIKVN